MEDLIKSKDEHSPDEKFSLSKKFHTFIKHKKTGIKTLKKNGPVITDPEQRADLLNNHFYSVFLQQITMKLSALCEYFTNPFQDKETHMPEIRVTEKGVLKLLPKVLKELSAELAPILTLPFQASLHQQYLTDIWKYANVNPIY